jgi:hypothetical protein
MASCFVYLLVRGVEPAVLNVVEDGIMEEHRILRAWAMVGEGSRRWVRARSRRWKRDTWHKCIHSALVSVHV